MFGPAKLQCKRAQSSPVSMLLKRVTRAQSALVSLGRRCCRRHYNAIIGERCRCGRREQRAHNRAAKLARPMPMQCPLGELPLKPPKCLPTLAHCAHKPIWGTSPRQSHNRFRGFWGICRARKACDAHNNSQTQNSHPLRLCHRSNLPICLLFDSSPFN